MRPIKFRVWELRSLCMRETRGLLLDEYGNITNIKVSTDDPTTFKINTDPYSYVPMQYTCLNDSYGKEIYEGDIVWADGFRWHVYWDELHRCFCFGCLDEEIDVTLDNFTEHEIQVVGNIYENRDVLLDGWNHYRQMPCGKEVEE